MIVPRSGFRRLESSADVVLRVGARRAVDPLIDEGRAGDHAVVFAFLQSVGRGLGEAEFQATSERPGYSPSHRLLVRRGDTVTAHLRQVSRDVRCQGAAIPACDFVERVVLPESALAGDDALLLAAAETRAAAQRAGLVTTQGGVPDSMQQAGWRPVGHTIRFEASPHDILSRCPPENLEFGRSHHRSTHDRPVLPSSPDKSHFVVRPWRYVELEGLSRLYDENTVAIPGAPVRDESYWRWLMTRRGIDQVLIAALESPSDDGDALPVTSEILGYLLLRKGDIVEWMVSPEQLQVMWPLWRRAALDAIERDSHVVRMHAPPSTALCPRMAGVLTAFDATALSDSDQQQWAKVIDVGSVLQALADGWSESRGDVPITKMARLALQLNGAWWTVGWNGTRWDVVRGKQSRTAVRASGDAVTDLLLGLVAPGELAADGRLDVANSHALEITESLWCSTQPWWRSILDDLPSLG